MNKKNVDYINDFLTGEYTGNMPNWLQFLVDTEVIHQNYEHIVSMKELSPHSVLRYVHKTLTILEEIKDQLISEEMYWQIATVLSYSEVAKGGTIQQRNEWISQNINISVHNEGSADIFLNDYIGYDKPLLYLLIKTHGYIGQYLRGETRLIANKELVEMLISFYSIEEARVLLYYLNQCIIRGVSEELWSQVKYDVEDTIEKLLKGDFLIDFDLRIDKLTKSFKEPYEEKQKIMRSKFYDYEMVNSSLAEKDLWYVEPSMHDLSFEDFWAILVLVSKELQDRNIIHVNFEKLMQLLHFDYQGRKHNNVYRKRVIEKFLQEYRTSGNPDTTHVNFKMELLCPFQTAYIYFAFSDIGEALITFCVEAEKTGGIMHNRATVLLFDLFELRRDAYDRFNNESTYLEHMNSSADDKRVIIDFIKGDIILDVGPGGGVMLDMLEAETENKTILGIDISENVIEALQKKKKEESHAWDVMKGDALNLIDTFEENSLDTIIYSSIIHELFSYIPFEGKPFNHKTIKVALESAYSVLKPGGRIIIRDGIMTEEKDVMRIIRFKDQNGMRFLSQYARDFKGREIEYEILSANEVRMNINDSMEFLYTYTWGPDSYAHELNEQFGYFTPKEYELFIKDIFGDKVKIIHLDHYLQDGYTKNLMTMIDYETEDGKSSRLPDSTCLIVLQKA